jgi:hypothetical protein
VHNIIRLGVCPPAIPISFGYPEPSAYQGGEMKFAARVFGAAVSVCVLAGATSPALARPQTAQSKACSEEATHQGLRGKSRASFRVTCMKGAMAPKTPTAPTGPGREANAVTKPSGVDRTTRSQQCSDEADRRKLQASQRDAFRLSCLASAAPVSASGTREIPRPTKAIPKLGTETSNPPH